MLYGLNEVDRRDEVDEILERLDLFITDEGRARVVLTTAVLDEVAPAIVIAAKGAGAIVSFVGHQHKPCRRGVPRRRQQANRIHARIE